MPFRRCWRNFQRLARSNRRDCARNWERLPTKHSFLKFWRFLFSTWLVSNLNFPQIAPRDSLTVCRRHPRPLSRQQFASNQCRNSGKRLLWDECLRKGWGKALLKGFITFCEQESLLLLIQSQLLVLFILPGDAACLLAAETWRLEGTKEKCFKKRHFLLFLRRPLTKCDRSSVQYTLSCSL